jgi:MFS family permease
MSIACGSSSDPAIVLILGRYFGSLADEVGRRPALFAAVFGMVCSFGWTYIACTLFTFFPRTNCSINLGYFWKTLPIELVWLTSIFRIIA